MGRIYHATVTNTDSFHLLLIFHNIFYNCNFHVSHFSLPWLNLDHKSYTALLKIIGLLRFFI